MKIIYITTSMNEEDYNDYVKLWSRFPNPSNQVFHNRLIHALSYENTIEVISLRPFSKKYCALNKLDKSIHIEGNITWRYMTIKSKAISRYISVMNELPKVIKSIMDENTVILTDTINPLCLVVAGKISKRFKLPLIGIVKDSPSNTPLTPRKYTITILRYAKRCHGFIATTSQLNTLYNDDNKPNIIIEGCAEVNNARPYYSDKPYFFYCGSLLRRYGIYELINAFKELQRPDIDLLIAGHSQNDHDLTNAIFGSHNIKFLGCITHESALALEKGAMVLVNPRPYSEDLDRFSIPNKVIEYLTSENIIVSVKNSKIMKSFEDDIIWIDSAYKNDLLSGLRYALSLSYEQRKAIATRGKEKVLEMYSKKTVCLKINEFLEQFINKSK